MSDYICQVCQGASDELFHLPLDNLHPHSAPWACKPCARLLLAPEIRPELRPEARLQEWRLPGKSRVDDWEAVINEYETLLSLAHARSSDLEGSSHVTVELKELSDWAVSWWNTEWLLSAALQLLGMTPEQLAHAAHRLQEERGASQ